MEKLKSFDKKILERDDTREVIKLYTLFIGELADFEKTKIDGWSASIETSSQVKLKNSILRREKALDSDLCLLYVNFDPLIVNLLKESKYFILLGLSIPDRAADIFKQAEVFRRHTGNLELIINMYNDIQTSLLSVERPLVGHQLEKLDRSLSQGFSGDKGSSKPLNWKSSGIDAFIAEAMGEVRDVSDVVRTLQENLKQVEQTVEVWKAHPLFERTSKTLPVEDFILQQRTLVKTTLSLVSDGGHQIQHLIKDTYRRLKISQGSPDWKAYVDYVNNVVCFGLIGAMHTSLVAMTTQFDPFFIEKNCLAPLLEVQMDLISKQITFVPEVGFVENGAASGPKTGMKNIVECWIEEMFGLSSSFSRLDLAEGTYLREIADAALIRDQLSLVNALLLNVEEHANKLRKQFQKYETLWLADQQVNLKQLTEEALQIKMVPHICSIDQSDTPFDRGSIVMGMTSQPDPSSTLKATEDPEECESWKQVSLDLDKFSQKITSLLKIQDEISEMKSMYEVVFLRVNAQPVKQAISTCVTKALYTFTYYLQNFITVNLADVHGFLKNTNVGLDRKVEPGQRDTIISVMTHIRAVKRRMPELSFGFIQLENIVALLKKHSIVIDLGTIDGQQGALEFLDTARAQWDGLVNKTFRVKESLQPLQTNMLDSIHMEVSAFERTLDAALRTFRLHAPTNSDTKKTEPYVTIDRFHKELASLAEQSKVLIETEDLFELPKSKHLQVVAYQLELKCLKEVWDMNYLVNTMVVSWRSLLWDKVDCESLLEESKSMDQLVKRFPPLCREWELMKTLEIKLRNTMVTLPLVKDLHSPAIRDRHWKLVSQVTGATLNRGPTFSLDDLLSTSQIHLHIEPINDIIEVANKELKIESRLTAIEEVWMKLRLGFELHKENDPLLMVVKPPDEILEVLDDHVLQLQNMAGMGKFVDFFREQVTEWQTTLGEVEATLKLLCMVTKLWSSLESIFLGSDDIRLQMPLDAARFDEADAIFRNLMSDMQANTYAIECLTFPGRDAMLQQVLRELEKCEYSLNAYLEVKKSIFPRFYFVSNTALLDILRYVFLST